ncbi:MAG: M48 family metalloprotease, partial [Armatimonadetes bacterium]|nr:M48 family metalloprotease [Armatimonadota bacterium]
MYSLGYGIGHRRGGLPLGRLLIALVIAAGSFLSYCSSRSVNEVTGEVQHVGLSVDQEIALGLEAAPQMALKHGGELPDAASQARADRIGDEILAAVGQTPYRFDFHVLTDPDTINAFALPGGQIFITRGLQRRLTTEGQLAGVLAHEVGHVIGRHSAEQIAKAKLSQGLSGAAVMATYDPANPSSRNSAYIAQMIGQLVNLRFGREDELEADRLGVRYMARAGYDPQAMIKVMEVLKQAAGGGRTPEFFATHPNPENRIARIKEAI